VKQVTITANLPDMLRDYLDQVTKPREIPSQDEIKAFLDESNRLDDARKDIVAGYLTRRLINLVIDQKETLTVLDSLGPWVAGAEQNTYLEDYYAYQFVDTLPQIIERAQAVIAVLVKTPPRKEIIVILREAFRSYIHGLYVACVCICRCILEQLLEESLRGSKRKLISIGFYKRLDGRPKSPFEVLIDNARHENILDERGSEIAKRIIKQGNEAAHKGRSSERIALKALLDLQVLLRDYFLKKDEWK
jgi:hypothetical protein